MLRVAPGLEITTILFRFGRFHLSLNHYPPWQIILHRPVQNHNSAESSGLVIPPHFRMAVSPVTNTNASSCANRSLS